jgi:hypothetical protein
MIHYLTIFFNLLLMSNLLLLVIPIIFCCCVTLYIFRKKYFRVTIKDMQIKNIYIVSFNLFLILLLVFSIFVYWRILNIGKILNLQKFLYNFSLILMTKNLFFSILLIIFFFVLFMLLIQIILLIQKFIFYYLLKVHIYLMVYTLKDDYLEFSVYEKILQKLSSIAIYYFWIPRKILKIFCYIFYFIIRKVIYKENSETFKEHFIVKKGKYQTEFEYFCDILEEKINFDYYKSHFNTYMMLSFFLYDVFFNNLIITKIYYILPLIFCYYLLTKYLNIPIFIERADCIKVHYYLTKKIKTRTNTIIIFDDNTEVNIEDIKIINRKIIRNILNQYLPPYFEKIKYKKSMLLFTIFVLYAIFNIKIIITFIIYKNVYVIDSFFVFLILLLLQVYFWFIVNRYSLLSNIYIIFYIITFFLLSIIFFKHQIPLLYNDFYDYTFIKINDFYSLEEKIYFIKEYLKENLQDDSFPLIINNLPLNELIFPDTSISQLKLYADNIILLHNKYQDLLSFLLSKKNNDIIQDIETQQSLINNTMKSYIITFWENIKTKYIKIT